MGKGLEEHGEFKTGSGRVDVLGRGWHSLPSTAMQRPEVEEAWCVQEWKEPCGLAVGRGGGNVERAGRHGGYRTGRGHPLTLAQLQALARAGQVLARWVLGPLQTGQHG